MARKKDSSQKAALRELMGNYLKENNVKVKDGTDVNSIMRDMMSIILEGALDQELDEELGYSKYDYRNKETDNSRNGYSQKTLHTSYGDMEIDIPRDRKGDFEPQVVKKYQNSITQDMEEKIISMYAKGMTTADIESHMRELYDIEISDSSLATVITTSGEHKINIAASKPAAAWIDEGAALTFGDATFDQKIMDAHKLHAESRNDDYKYAELATQEDFDRF